MFVPRPGAYYIGVSREVEKRLRTHWDDQFIDTRQAVRFLANVSFLTTCGYKRTLAVIRVADRETAERLECDWT